MAYILNLVQIRDSISPPSSLRTTKILILLHTSLNTLHKGI